MKTTRPGIAITLALLVALVASLATQSSAYAPDRATVVAVIDVMRLYTELSEKLALEAEQQQARTRLEEERKRRIAEIQSLEKDLEDLNVPGSTAYETKQDELLTKTAEYQAWFSIQQQRLQRDMAVRIQAIEKKMNDAIDKTAKDNRIDLVLNRESNIPIGQQQQQQQNFNLRMVLYATDQLDITDEVAQLMNNDFQNRPVTGQ